MNPLTDPAVVEELNRLYTCACRAHHACRIAEADRKLAPNVIPFGLRQDYQRASQALAAYLRAVKRQDAAT